MKHYLALSAAILLFTLPTSQASVVFYDGFAAGGATPAAGEYVSGGGFTQGDHLHGQAPATTGFSGGDAWIGSPGGLVDGVYFQTTPTGLSYSNNGLQLATTEGGVRFLDTFSNFDKFIRRDVDNQPTPGAESWFSMLVRYETTTTWDSYADFSLVQGVGGDPTAGRHIGFGINQSGELELFASGNSLNRRNEVSEVISALTPGVDHLLLLQMEDRPFGSTNNTDRFNVWLDPDLDTIGAADATVTGTHVYVGSNSSYRFDRFQVNTEIFNNTNDQYFFDELRLGTTLADVLPTSALVTVPEPGTVILTAIGLLGIFCVRRSKRRATTV